MDTTTTRTPAAAGPASAGAGPDAMLLLGRLLMALLFVPAGISKIGGFEGTVGYIASRGLPLPQAGAALAIVVELGVGLMLLAGWRTRLSALALAAFTLVAGVLFHDFWASPPDQVMAQQINFFKNLAVTGGLLAFAAAGAGRYSLDARTRRG